MDIPVYDHDAGKSVGLRVARSSRLWVEQAVAMTPIGVGMVPAQAEAVGSVKISGPHLVDRFEHTAEPGLIAGQTVFQPAALRAQAWRDIRHNSLCHTLELLEVCCGMYAGKGVQGCDSQWKGGVGRRTPHERLPDLREVRPGVADERDRFGRPGGGHRLGMEIGRETGASAHGAAPASRRARRLSVV